MREYEKVSFIACITGNRFPLRVADRGRQREEGTDTEFADFEFADIVGSDLYHITHIA